MKNKLSISITTHLVELKIAKWYVCQIFHGQKYLFHLFDAFDTIFYRGTIIYNRHRRR